MTMRIYEVRPRRDGRGVDVISDALPFGRLWYGGLRRNPPCRARNRSFDKACLERVKSDV